MGATLPDRLNAAPRKMTSLRGEAERKKVSPETVRQIGQAIDAALKRAGLTQKEAAYLMGYENQSLLARWISGVETPQFARLWTLGESFQQALVIELASACQVGVKVRTTIELEQSA
jgi:ribosome-binding protein aMBF1 (putative translation factor)